MEKEFKILVIEDDPVHRTVLESILTDEGYNVITTINGEDGINIAESEDVDLIITDIHMPVKDGFEVCREITSNPDKKYIPVVILTANQNQEDIVFGFEQGAFDYILKPFDNQELMARINAAIKFKELREELIAERQKTVLFELAGAAAHELNQPLTVLKTTAFLVKDKFSKEQLTEGEFLKYMDKMEIAIDRMSVIIKKMNELKEYKTKDYAMGQKIINLTDSEEN